MSQTAEENDWAPATVNRYRALISLVFRLGIENGKVENPARLVKHRQENNARVRWLSGEGEARLRAVIAESSGEHMPELDLALNAGMRLGEMYTLAWEHVNLPRRVLTIPRSKNGEKRHVPLINIRTVQELMGHKDITMTLRYSHLAPKRTLGAVQQLSEPVMEIATGTKTSTEPKAPVQSETGYVQ